MKLIKNFKFPPASSREASRAGKIKNSRKGFTLIEMLVVVFVVSIGLVGALSFYNININNQFEAKNELVAANLTQEGVELVRNLVDFERLKGDAWDTTIQQNLTNCHYIDFNSLSGTHPCNNGGNTSICFSNGRYQQCLGGTDIGMQRGIIITYDATSESLTVIATVTWNNNSRTTTAKDVLFNNSF